MKASISRHVQLDYAKRLHALKWLANRSPSPEREKSQIAMTGGVQAVQEQENLNFFVHLNCHRDNLEICALLLLLLEFILVIDKIKCFFTMYSSKNNQKQTY